MCVQSHINAFNHVPVLFEFLWHRKSIRLLLQGVGRKRPLILDTEVTPCYLDNLGQFLHSFGFHFFIYKMGILMFPSQDVERIK